MTATTLGLCRVDRTLVSAARREFWDFASASPERFELAEALFWLAKLRRKVKRRKSSSFSASSSSSSLHWGSLVRQAGRGSAVGLAVGQLSAGLSKTRDFVPKNRWCHYDAIWMPQYTWFEILMMPFGCHLRFCPKRQKFKGLRTSACSLAKKSSQAGKTGHLLNPHVRIEQVIWPEHRDSYQMSQIRCKNNNILPDFLVFKRKCWNRLGAREMKEEMEKRTEFIIISTISQCSFIL